MLGHYQMQGMQLMMAVLLRWAKQMPFRPQGIRAPNGTLRQCLLQGARTLGETTQQQQLERGKLPAARPIQTILCLQDPNHVGEVLRPQRADNCSGLGEGMPVAEGDKQTMALRHPQKVGLKPLGRTKWIYRTHRTPPYDGPRSSCG